MIACSLGFGCGSLGPTLPYQNFAQQDSYKTDLFTKTQRGIQPTQSSFQGDLVAKIAHPSKEKCIQNCGKNKANATGGIWERNSKPFQSHQQQTKTKMDRLMAHSWAQSCRSWQILHMKKRNKSSNELCAGLACFRALSGKRLGRLTPTPCTGCGERLGKGRGQ